MFRDSLPGSLPVILWSSIFRFYNRPIRDASVNRLYADKCCRETYVWWTKKKKKKEAKENSVRVIVSFGTRVPKTRSQLVINRILETCISLHLPWLIHNDECIFDTRLHELQNLLFSSSEQFVEEGNDGFSTSLEQRTRIGAPPNRSKLLGTEFSFIAINMNEHRLPLKESTTFFRFPAWRYAPIYSSSFLHATDERRKNTHVGRFFFPIDRCDRRLTLNNCFSFVSNRSQGQIPFVQENGVLFAL